MSFCFYCYAHHRDLHSFPTRRSSDLASRPPRRLTSSSFGSTRQFWHASRARRYRIEPTPAGKSELVNRRSEEHTSELQSLAYLVCRLLLEKKKNERPKPPTLALLYAM